jgi:hypothetical protein
MVGFLFARKQRDGTAARILDSCDWPVSASSISQKVELRMRPAPSIVPPGDEHDVYLVMDDFDRLGRSWCEADEHDTYRESVIRDLLAGQYNVSPALSIDTA